jgi:SAM-dependent methyltransferase
MNLLAFLQENATAHEWSQRLASLNFRRFLPVLRAEGFFAPGLSYLDLGCGAGFLRDHLPFADYLGLDIDPACIRAARRKRDECFEVANALDLGFLPRSFDRIVAIGLLRYLDDEQVAAALEQCRQHLNPGGEVFVIDALPGDSDAPFVRSPEQWRALLENGLALSVWRSFRRWPTRCLFARGAQRASTVAEIEPARLAA